LPALVSALSQGQSEEGRMKGNTLSVLRRFLLVTMVSMGVLGLVGYLAMAQDQTGAGANLPPLTTTTIPPSNPLQVAILRWYPANLTTSFGAGSNPSGVAFDGANIWVANTGSNTVTKLRASDGSTLGTFTVESNPVSVVFDGANIWVTNYSSNTVTKLRASDGTMLGTFSTGTIPYGVAFDGANIWVANYGSKTVSKL
jgi:hypothetical protein